MYIHDEANVYFNTNICDIVTDAELEDVRTKIEKYVLEKEKEKYKKLDVVEYNILDKDRLLVSYYPHKEDGTVDKTLLYIAYVSEGNTAIFTFFDKDVEAYSLGELLDLLILKAYNCKE